MMCLGVGLFASISFWTLCASWTCMSISFTKIRAVFFHYFLKTDFQFLALCLFLWHPYDANVGSFEVVPEAAYTIFVGFFLILFLLVVPIGFFFVFVFALPSKDTI